MDVCRISNMLEPHHRLVAFQRRVQTPQSVPHTTNLRIVAGDFHERVEHAAGRRYLIELGVAEYLAATSYTIGSINRHKGCQAIACISSQDQGIRMGKNTDRPASEHSRVRPL